ncbi:MAG: flagellar biosynthesis protein FlhB [Synergistaceae bacterium]|jgi:flagellar biosynthetic protein FlhB|nr:flagellar biosynthesis protein FlhB [Synergistaceae bacterium]
MGARGYILLEMNSRRSEPDIFDIQFFAEEKTEPATPRKRQKTREEGQTARSQDLSAAVVIITGLLSIYALSATIWQRMIALFKDLVRHIGSPLMFDDAWWARPLVEGAKAFFVGWLPVGILCAIVALAVMIYQVGFVITTKPLVPKPDRFNPVSGLKKIISARSLVELVKGIVKALVLLGLLFMMIRNERDLMLSVMMFSMERGFSVIMGKVWDLALRMTLALLVIAMIDYLYQKWEFEKSIKMSKQEIKEEYKQMEGDPKIKQKIRQKQRELARSRMMADVPKADAVITNPTRIAVAIKYEQMTMSAPTVVAKGEGFIAMRIKDIAVENNIPVVENRPLARALMRQVEVGESIPEDLYRAVAEVLAFVYRLKKKDWAK